MDLPSHRALVLGTAVKIIAATPGPITVSALLHALMAELKLPEENVGEYYDVAFLLQRHGLVEISTRYPSGEVYIGGGTTLTSSRPLIDYVWYEGQFPGDEDEAA